MKEKNTLFVVLLLILSPVVMVLLMSGVGALMGSDYTGVNVVIVGIAILCDVVIGCTLIVVASINRLTRMIEKKK